MNDKTIRIFILMGLIVATLVFHPALCSGVDVTENDIALKAEPMEKEPIPDKDLPAKGGNTTQMSLLDLIQKGGVVGYLIILISIVSLGLIIEYSFVIRKSKILPPKDIAALQLLIRHRTPEKIASMDKDTASFLSKVVIAGLKESPLGYQNMIKAMEDAGEALASSIARKTEHLNVIGNISPMLGLLGTVTGMLRCFNELAHVAGAIEPKQLAAGIFEALVTTCLGLIVAIPALYCYALFRNRVDEYTGEALLVAEQLVSSFKSEQQG